MAIRNRTRTSDTSNRYGLMLGILFMAFAVLVAGYMDGQSMQRTEEVPNVSEPLSR